MSALHGQIAFEIDAEQRIATIVFFGPVSDQQVIDFYATGAIDQAAIDGFGCLFDLRHTKWIPDPATVRLLAQH